jgi:hypothetical protein
VNYQCTHCGSALMEEGLRATFGIDWRCRVCGRAGVHVLCRVGDREVLVRDETVPGDPALRRDWVPADSMPYAERVRPIGDSR